MTVTVQPTRVTGASDDLIELEGGIREEFASFDEASLLTFNTGVQLRIHYTNDGIWRITNLRPHFNVTIIRAEDRPGWTGPDGDMYSDVAIVKNATRVYHRKDGQAP